MVDAENRKASLTNCNTCIDANKLWQKDRDNDDT